MKLLFLSMLIMSCKSRINGYKFKPKSPGVSDNSQMSSSLENESIGKDPNLGELIECVKSGDFENLKVNIEKVRDINALDVNGKIVLMHLQDDSQNNLEIVEFLIEKGVNINVADKDGVTLLMHASKKGFKKLVELLIQKKTLDVNAKDEDNASALIYALQSQHYAVAEMIIDAGAHINEIDNRKRTVLMIESAKGNIDAVNLLLNKGASLEYRDIDGRNALMLAAKNGRLEIIKFLLSKCKDKIDINLADKKGKTALMIAIEKGKREVIDFLLSNGAELNAEAIIISVAKEDKNRMRAVELILDELKKDVDINYKDEDGKTALMYATENENKEFVDFLLNRGAKASIETDDGSTAATFAEKNKENDLFDQLKKLEIEEKSYELMTLLTKGNLTNSESNDFKRVVTLVKQGVDTFSIGEKKQSALNFFLEKGHMNLANTILSLGVNQNENSKYVDSKDVVIVVRNENNSLGDSGIDTMNETLVNTYVKTLVGSTVGGLRRSSPIQEEEIPILIFASRNGDINLVKRLISQNILLLNLKDKNGKTALMNVIEKVLKEEVKNKDIYFEIIEVFLDSGVDLRIVDNNEDTVMTKVLEADNPKVLDFLKAKGVNVEAIDILRLIKKNILGLTKTEKLKIAFDRCILEKDKGLFKHDHIFVYMHTFLSDEDIFIKDYPTIKDRLDEYIRLLKELEIFGLWKILTRLAELEYDYAVLKIFESKDFKIKDETLKKIILLVFEREEVDLKLLRTLLSKNSSYILSIKDKENNTLMMNAIKRKRLDLLKFVLNFKIENNYLKNESLVELYNCIVKAVELENIEILTLLLETSKSIKYNTNSIASIKKAIKIAENKNSKHILHLLFSRKIFESLKRIYGQPVSNISIDSIPRVMSKVLRVLYPLENELYKDKMYRNGLLFYIFHENLAAKMEIKKILKELKKKISLGDIFNFIRLILAYEDKFSINDFSELVDIYIEEESIQESKEEVIDRILSECFKDEGLEKKLENIKFIKKDLKINK